MTGEVITDTQLVTLCLDGDRDAFGQIVSRYQSLICSLAYSATGSLGQSQDRAQETFITAWKHLRLLRERQKLRAWLCGIARCLIGKALRRERREPIHAAEPLEAAQESADVEPLPSDRLISKEEEAILWRSIGRIPEIFREPLVLFYREHQSVEKVAAALNLGEDAVKQRLSRGRKLLHEEVLGFIEGALERSSPGKAFTIGVLAALPVFASSATAAGIGVTAAKAGASTKAGALLASTAGLAGPLAAFLSTFLSYNASMEGASSEKERRFIKRFYGVLSMFIVAPVGLLLLAVWARPLAESHPGVFAGIIFGAVLAWIPAIALLLVWIRRTARELNAAPGAATSKAKRLFEYRTKTCLFGLPLVHVRFGATWSSLQEPVRAWIAIADDAAIGVIFAFGGMAIAPICIGGFAVGGVVFSGFGAGVLCYAGFGLGVWTVGGLVSGLMAVGGCAAGWKAALGGIAVAHQFAQGGVALAPHANDAVAQAFIGDHAFFHYSLLLVTKWLWPTLLATTLPSLFIWRATRKRRNQEQRSINTANGS